jgi:hypothetical protein
MIPTFVLPLLREQLTQPIDPSFLHFFQARLVDGVKVAFEVRGFDDDPRELFEVPELCAWMREFFILLMPRALATLDSDPKVPGLVLVQACCNDSKRHPLGVTIAVSAAWQDACAQAQIPVQ